MKKTLLGAVISASVTFTLCAQTTQYQTNQLQLGWNLIAFQTIPTNPSSAAVFSTNLFRSVWTFDNGSGLWSQFGRQPAGNSEQSGIVPMGNIQLGRAYWAYYDASFTTNWVVNGVASNGAFNLNFNQGWNLVGFPSGNSTNVNVISIFRPGDLTNIQLIVRWEASNQVYQVYDPKSPEMFDFQSFNPNLGHWIKASAQLSIQPSMVVDAQGDIDLPPLNFPAVTNGTSWTPGPEDASIVLPGDTPIFHDRTAETTIIVPKGVNSVLLPLYNSGGGILLWNASFMGGASRSGASTLSGGDAGHVLSLAQANGVTSSETDTLQISVDRTHLSPGTYLAKLNISASTGQQKTFDLVIEVGSLDGQWQGTASIQTVNGKSNAIPDVDLFIHLFQDTTNGSFQLRGIIDSQETLLWPMDAQLLGHITDTPAGNFDPNYASRFVISGGFTMPPGDVLHYPFSTFATDTNDMAIDGDTGLPYLTDAKGDRWYKTLPGRASAPDFLNPFPRFISREVELDGQISGMDGGAAVATGTYYETIMGMSPQPIEMIGTFSLTQKGFTPLERRPYTYFASVPLNGYPASTNASVSNQIPVADHVIINRVIAVVAQNAPANEHTLQLTGPNGVSITLHGGQALGPNENIVFDSGELPVDPLTLLQPPELRGATPLPTASGSNPLDRAVYQAQLQNSLASYAVRRPRQSLQAFNNIDGFGTWTLKYGNLDSTATHALLGWSLLIYGVPSYTIAGHVVVAGSTDPNRFQDVSVQVLGLNASLDSAFTTIDRTTGFFTISSLPGLRVNLQALKPGYLPASIDGLNTASDPRGYHDNLGGIIIGGPGTTNLVLTLNLPPTTVPPEILTATENFNVTDSNGVTQVQGGDATLIADTPDSDIIWKLDWLGVASPPVAWSVSGVRDPLINLAIPTSAFTISNNFTVAYRAHAYSISTGVSLSYGDWVTVTLQNPSPPVGINPYWNTVLLQGTVLQGFGTFNGQSIWPDTNGPTSLHAQKTDCAIVDVDRTPLINPTLNPTLDFRLDGLTDASGDAEDTDLYPRTFTVNKVGAKNNQWAYAEINPNNNFLFDALVPPLPGQTPIYNDAYQIPGIDGRDINALGEPVRIYTALGGRFCNLDLPASDGQRLISAGANPGVNPLP